MRVFLCWSGKASLGIATALKEFLGDVIQELKPFLSTESIRKGDRWRSEIAQQLADTDYGVLCLTKDNLQAPWILFEAGALSKNIAKSRVTALLAGIQAADVIEPLSQFQHTGTDHNEILKLLQEMNELLPQERRLDAERLKRSFDQFWPEFEARILEALKPSGLGKAAIKQRGTDEMVAEILVLVREVKRSLEPPQLSAVTALLAAGNTAYHLAAPGRPAYGLLGDVFKSGLLAGMQGSGDEQLPNAGDPTIGDVVK